MNFDNSLRVENLALRIRSKLDVCTSIISSISFLHFKQIYPLYSNINKFIDKYHFKHDDNYNTPDYNDLRQFLFKSTNKKIPTEEELNKINQQIEYFSKYYLIQKKHNL